MPPSVMEKSLSQTGFLERERGYVAAMASDEQTHRDLDAPAPPGSPMRQDTPDASVNPGPAPNGDPEHAEPEVQPSSTPDGPQTVPSGDPAPPTQAGFENAQAENAESSLDEPSDNSGAE